MKILILRFSSIGDIVLTSPVIRALKTQLEDAEVHFCTKRQYLPLLKENPYLDQIHILDGSLNDLIGQLKKESYDLIVDLHHNLRTRYIKSRLGVKSVAYNKLNIEKWLFTNLKINRLPNVHVVDRYLETVKYLGIKPDHMGLDYYIPESDEVDWDWLPKGFNQGFAALVIGGKYATKRLPTDRLIELCDRINKPVILLGGPKDQATGEAIESFFSAKGDSSFDEGLKDLGKNTTVWNACGKMNINQSASLLKKSSWVFAHDTGLMHIAAAFKKPLFTIWGNTVPAFGMYPYQTQFTVFENNRLNCRPCSKIGYDKCPKGHFDCMNKLTFDFYLPD